MSYSPGRIVGTGAVRNERWKPASALLLSPLPCRTGAEPAGLAAYGQHRHSWTRLGNGRLELCVLRQEMVGDVGTSSSNYGAAAKLDCGASGTPQSSLDSPRPKERTASRFPSPRRGRVHPLTRRQRAKVGGRSIGGHDLPAEYLRTTDQTLHGPLQGSSVSTDSMLRSLA